MKFKKFMNAVCSEFLPNASEDLTETIGKLNILADPKELSRDEYYDIHDDIFGDVETEFDRRDAKEILNSSLPILPASIQDNINEDAVQSTLIDNAVNIAADYRNACLALGVSDAIYEMTDERVLPSALVKEYEINSTEGRLLDAMDKVYGETFEGSDEEEDDATDLDSDDGDDDYYDAD